MDDNITTEPKSSAEHQTDQGSTRNSSDRKDYTAPTECQSSVTEKKAPEEEDVAYPSGVSLAIITISLLFSIICLGLDRSIVAVAVPKITTEFHSTDDVAWYGSAYMLGTCCFQLLFGKLYAEFSVKWVYLSALFIFEVGSVVCAAAPTSVALIIGRALAGIGAAGLVNGGIIIISHTVPLASRPKYTGMLGGTMGIAMVVAPTLGGAFTDKATWRWCFWINLPFGGITFATILFLVNISNHNKNSNDKSLSPLSRFKQFLAKFDLTGTSLLIPWIICILLALQWGGNQYAWSSWRIILLLVLFAVMLVTWLVIQYFQGDKATVPFRVVKQRSMACCCVYMFCLFSNFAVLTYYIPIWFQGVKGVSAYKTGIDFLATSITMAVTVVFAGFATSKIGYYVPPMILSVIIGAVGNGLLYTFKRDTSTVYWAASLVLIGASIGLGGQQPLMAAQTVFKGPDIAISTSVLIFWQMFAGTLIITVAQSVFQTQLVKELGRLVPAVDPKVVLGAGVSDVAEVMGKVYPQYVDGILDSYNLALQRVFLMALIFTCLSVFPICGMEWVSVKKGGEKGGEKAEPVKEDG